MDRLHEAAEERERELQALNATLEWQVQARKATLVASAGGPPTGEARLHMIEDTLTLEVMECQVVTAEDALHSREATIQGEADERVAAVLRALA